MNGVHAVGIFLGIIALSISAGLVMTILKLAGALDFPWVWTLAPIWIPAILILGAATAIVFIKGVIEFLTSHF